MIDNFFKIVDPKFFNPLTGLNKAINYEILFLINEKMKNSVESHDKKDVVNWIEEYLDNHPSYEKIDDEDLQEDYSDNHDFAIKKLNYLIKCGWISSETVGFSQLLTLDSAGVSVLNAMSDAVRNETKPIEYTGYVYNIHNILLHFDISRSTALIEMLERTANDFSNSLRSVNLSIKKYLTALLKDDNNSAKEILSMLLVDYHENVIEKVFTNLRTGDNPARYKNSIIEKIDNLLENNMGDMVDNYLQTKKTDGRFEAQEYIENVLVSIRSLFEEIGDSIDILNSKNEKYVGTATARVKFLLNNDRDLEGQIYDVLRLMAEKDVSSLDEFTFGIKELGKIDDSSLYKYSKRTYTGPVATSYIKPPVDENLNKKEVERIKRSLKYNVRNVDEWILKKLDDRECVEAKDIEIKDYDELIILFLCIVYSTNGYVHYQIEFPGKEEFVVFNHSRLENFKIKRKTR